MRKQFTLFLITVFKKRQFWARYLLNFGELYGVIKQIFGLETFKRIVK